MGEPKVRRSWARVGVKGLLVRGDRLLLLHRRADLDLWPGRWDLPGGGVEADATLPAALAREFLEETGFRVRVGPARISTVGGPTARGAAPRHSSTSLRSR